MAAQITCFGSTLGPPAGLAGWQLGGVPGYKALMGYGHLMVRCVECRLVGEHCVSPYKSSTNKGFEHCSIGQIWRCCGVKNLKLEPKVDQNSQSFAGIG